MTGLVDRIRSLFGAAERPPLTVILGGGAVRGAAHLGVLSVLEREGLRPQLIVGTSIGAILGAAFAAGNSCEALLDKLRELSWSGVVRPPFSLSFTSLLDIKPLEQMLEQTLGLSSFSELEIPFAAVACDLETGDPVVLSAGDLRQAVLASSALPGLFPPVEVDGRLLADGGLVENLPVDAARTLGAELVLAVDVSALEKGHRPDNFLEVWQRSLQIMIRANQKSGVTADLLLEPEVGDFSFIDFAHADELFDRGRVAAEGILDQLRQAMGLEEET